MDFGAGGLFSFGFFAGVFLRFRSLLRFEFVFEEQKIEGEGVVMLVFVSKGKRTIRRGVFIVRDSFA